MIWPCRSPGPDAMEDDVRIAVLDTSILAHADDDLIRCLSAAEFQRYRSLASAQRQREWLGARLAAKYLFLSRFELPGDGRHDSRAVTHLMRETLVSLPLWMWRSIEVATGCNPEHPGPFFRWRGGHEVKVALSLSHTGHDACACIAAGSDVGIDLQNVEQRVAAFYRTNYTAAEAQWVDRGAGCDPSGRDWLYTLLWTLKEAALKARVLVHTSPVSFGGVEVFELPAPETLLRACRQDDWRDRLMRITARIREERNIRRLEVAITGTRRMILTVVRPGQSDPAQQGTSVATTRVASTRITSTRVTS